MTTETDTPASTPTTDDQHPSPGAHPASTLRAVVVRYDNRPDRCTVSPCTIERDQLTTAWITADVAAFLDLAEFR